jgi:HEAT repeat protein
LAEASAARLRWSEPVGGLKARIERFDNRTPIFILLQNTSAAPLTVPGGTLGHEGPGYHVDVEWLTSEGWQKVPPPDPSDEWQKLVKPKRLTLQPGQTCLVQCNNDLREMPDIARAIRVTLTASEARLGEAPSPVTAKASAGTPRTTGSWTGRLETPPYPMVSNDAQWVWEDGPRGADPLPDYLPDFVHSDFLGPSGGIYPYGNTPDRGDQFGRAWIYNRNLSDALDRYRPAEVGREMMRRMRAEKQDLPLKFYYAALAAGHGDEDGKAFIVEQCQITRYRTLEFAFGALGHCGFNWRHTPAYHVPPWVRDAMIAALRDSRRLDFRGTDRRSDEPETVSSVAEGTGFPVDLGLTKAREAVPVLMDLVRRQKSTQAARALGMIGDARAVPVLLAAFESHVQEKQEADGNLIWAMKQFKDDPRVVPALIEALGKIDGKSERGDPLAEALGEMKAKAAVPALLNRLHSREAIAALGQIGDPRAIEPLRHLLTTEFREPPSSQGEDPNSEIRVALARLENADPVPALCELMIDPRLYYDNRYKIADELAELHDPRAVPFLVKVAKNDRDGCVLRAAMRALGEFKRKDAVAGLIECFDDDFKHLNVDKFSDQTRLSRETIVQSLYKMTGQTFGPDPQLWRAWWAKEGCNDPAFK